MILVGSRVYICDNSGAFGGRCVGLFKRVRYASVGSIIRVSVGYRRASKRRSLVSDCLQRALVIRQKSVYKRGKIGVRVFGSLNAVCILNSFNLPLANRIRGYSFYEIRDICLKVLSLVSIRL